MKRLFLGALLAALCAGPGLSRAETPGEPRNDPAAAAVDAQDGAPADPTQGEAADLAEREQVAPQQVGEFSGGADGVYITSGAILVALLVVLLLVAL
jgi:hypothetical protein